ncbi:Midasin [Lamellibrachia satsuma]|nr:Midasin [Lamellibrachia satsuma]
MKEGTMFLVDEISLADDSVLERLNSVLEPERTLVLAEKGGGDGAQNEVEQIFANDAFRIVATMNPGGDYGKKELSPALRNRFTEIWCPQSTDRTDLIAIIEHNLSPGVHLSNQEDGTSGIGRACMDFVHWFVNNNLGRRATVSIRDLLSWVNFVNVTSKTVDSDGDDKMEADTTGSSRLEPAVAYVHGACMTFLDALGSGVMGNSGMSSAATKSACLRFLLKQVVNLTGQQWDVHSLGLPTSHNECAMSKQPVVVTNDSLVIWPFSVPRGPRTDVTDDNYALDAPTTYANAQRVLRALQLPRPILLEGSPGVGKTSLVSAIARAASHHLVRINLSEQTDVTDLFGADLPVEGGQGGQFAWRDGPLLRALKAGHWIVLDELNLASQSVLEGLNACLDHRAEVYVPELGKTFHVEHGKTRLFACQNPLSQGGGRKGLPKSFLNRFTQVYVEQLSRADLLYITGALYPQLPGVMLAKMVDFNSKVYHQTMIEGHWGRKGSPWEFNLRDICRWCDLLVQNQTEEYYDPGEYVSLVYSDRMRTATDKQKVFTAFEETFESWPSEHCVDIRITTDHVQIGHSWLKRRGTMVNLDASGSGRVIAAATPLCGATGVTH